MKISKKCKFLGSNTKNTKEGSEYFIISLLIDNEACKIFSNFPIILEFGEECIINFEYNFYYKKLYIKSYELI